MDHNHLLDAAATVTGHCLRRLQPVTFLNAQPLFSQRNQPREPVRVLWEQEQNQTRLKGSILTSTKYRGAKSQRNQSPLCRNTTRGFLTCCQQRLLKAASAATTRFQPIATVAAPHPEVRIQQLPSAKLISVAEQWHQLEGKSNNRLTWNPKNKSMNLKQQVFLTRTLRAWQPPVWQQRKRLKAVQTFWHHFSFWDKVKLNNNQNWPCLVSPYKLGTFLNHRHTDIFFSLDQNDSCWFLVAGVVNKTHLFFKNQQPDIEASEWSSRNRGATRVSTKNQTTLCGEGGKQNKNKTRNVQNLIYQTLERRSHSLAC